MLIVAACYRIFLVTQATGSQLGFISAGLCSVVGGLIVSFLTSWRLSLLMTAFAPVMLVSGLMMTKSLGASTRENLEEEAAKVREGVSGTR